VEFLVRLGRNLLGVLWRALDVMRQTISLGLLSPSHPGLVLRDRRRTRSVLISFQAIQVTAVNDPEVWLAFLPRDGQVRIRRTRTYGTACR
jgi:hypothetical protein